MLSKAISDLSYLRHLLLFEEYFCLKLMFNIIRHLCQQIFGTF